MSRQLDCRYSKICMYHILNCDEEFQHCGLFAKYARKESQDRIAREEELRQANLFDIGLVAIIHSQQKQMGRQGKVLSFVNEQDYTQSLKTPVREKDCYQGQAHLKCPSHTSADTIQDFRVEGVE